MLKKLTEEEFARRTDDGAVTPVFREFLADRETPVSVLTRAADDESVFLLESVVGGEARGRYSFLGVDPTSVYVADDETVKAAACADEKIQRLMEGKEIVKTIVGKNKLINLILI